MAEELGNKELIEKLPKEGVHCYPASPSKITRNRLLSVVLYLFFSLRLIFPDKKHRVSSQVYPFSP